jgi:hypothetical protein
MQVALQHGVSPRADRCEAGAEGDLRCAACGYAISSYVRLPQCPMCHGDEWEALLRRHPPVQAPARARLVR